MKRELERTPRRKNAVNPTNFSIYKINYNLGKNQNL